jgi:hypothetical protein
MIDVVEAQTCRIMADGAVASIAEILASLLGVAEVDEYRSDRILAFVDKERGLGVEELRKEMELVDLELNDLDEGREVTEGMLTLILAGAWRWAEYNRCAGEGAAVEGVGDGKHETIGEGRKSRSPASSGDQDEEKERLECSCDPYVWDSEGENVVDYDGSCHCLAGAESRERSAREGRAYDISRMGYALDEECNRVDMDGKIIGDEFG